jgi:hypothetical protein
VVTEEMPITDMPSLEPMDDSNELPELDNDLPAFEDEDPVREDSQ